MSFTHEQLVEGRLRHVFADTLTWAKTPMPAAIRESLEASSSPAPGVSRARPAAACPWPSRSR